MVKQYINTPQTAITNYTVNLGGTSYRFIQRWNDRSSSWYLDVLTSDGVLIKRAAKLLPNNPLINRNLSLFEGANLYVVNRSATGATVGRDNLGIDRTFTLIYMTDDEVS